MSPLVRIVAPQRHRNLAMLQFDPDLSVQMNNPG